MNTKMVLIVRKDLKMRAGKVAAQCSHAAVGAILNFSRRMDDLISISTNEALDHWLANSFRKIGLYVNSEEELFVVYDAARAAGLNVKLITDNGTTEFHGVPTVTCLAIGPDYDDRIDAVTGHLPLY